MLIQSISFKINMTSFARVAQAQHRIPSPSQKAWKLQDTVKLMRVNVSKAYRRKHASKDNGVTPREIKKWIKMDVYLFEYDMPVIKYCPKSANLSSSSNVNIQLNDVIKVEHVSKFSKPNVLAIDFPLFSLLLSFKTKERMDKWMSQLLCLTDIYTLLLYDTSNAKIKPGYYQLRFVLDQVTVNNAITKEAAWTWKVSHICGYTKTKSGTKIEVGKESSVNGNFYFTGKQIQSFCEHLQSVGHKIAQRKLRRGATFPLCKQPAQSVDNLLIPPRNVCTLPRHSNHYVKIAPCSLCPSTSVPLNLHLHTSRLHDHRYQASMHQLYDSASISSLSLKASFSDITSSVSSLEMYSVSLSRSTSVDSFKDKHQTEQHKSVLRKCVSLNNLDLSEEDENYVLPSILPLNASCSTLNTSNGSDYLTILLPNKFNCYEELQDPDAHYEKLCFEPEYSTVLDSMACH